MPRQLPPTDAALGSLADRILDAALTCVARVGVGKTTLDDVAREAGCARATLYRYFPNKQQLLAALVSREATVVGARVVESAAGATTLTDAIVSTFTTAADVLQGHAALTFVAAYEPEILLPFLAFEREDAVLRASGDLVAPAFTPFLSRADAERLGEWVARILFSYLCSPSDSIDVLDRAHVRDLVTDFVVPGFELVTNELDTTEGVSR
jgi:AcrR family transcriptional regulator